MTSPNIWAPEALALPTLSAELEVAYRLLYPGGSQIAWQRFAGDVMMRVRPDGQWFHDEVAVICGRQQGKTRGVINPRVLAGLLVLDDRIAHGAQDRELPRRTFLLIAELLETPPLSRLVKRINRGSGKEAIEMRTGGFYTIVSSRPRSTRGLEELSLLVLDEFLEQRDWLMMQALQSTQLAAARRQIIYCSTAGHAYSLPLHQLRARALDPDHPPSRLAWLEYSTDPGTDPDDPDEWVKANPAYPEVLTLEALEALREKSTESAWRQENLGQFVHLVAEHAFDLDAWELAAAATLPPPTDRNVAVAVEVDPSRTAAAVVAAWPLDDGRTAVELVAYPEADPLISDTRLAQLVIDWCQEREPRHPVAFDPWSSRNVADLIAAAGIRTEPVTGLEYVNACGQIVAEVAAGRIAHLGRDTLTGHVAATGRRTGSDGRWWFHRGPTPIVAATAATRAVWIATRPRPTLTVY